MEEEASTVSAEGTISLDGQTKMESVNIEITTPVISDIPETTNDNPGPENEADVKLATSNTSLSSSTTSSEQPTKNDDPTSKSSDENTPSEKKKKERPMSAAMQRLTAKKGESPESVAKNNISMEQRKVKADELRKKKILENRSKEEDRRAAVLERKKRLEDAERQKKEALFKKLTADSSKPNPTIIKKRYSVSTSNLAQLKKTRAVEKDINLDAGNENEKSESKTQLKTKPPERPRSAMQRNRPGSTNNLMRNKDRLAAEKTAEAKRPSTATTANKTKPTTRPPSTRLSLNPRPATSLGISAADRRKTIDSPNVKKTASSKTTSSSTLTKDSRPTSLLSRTTDVKKTSDAKKTPETKKQVEKKPKETRKSIESDTKKETKSTPDSKKLIEKKTPTKLADRPKSTVPASTTAAAKPKKTTPAKKDEKPPKQDAKKKQSDKNKAATPQRTEEEAKKALAERRRKAKEEAEEKARIEREKDEQEKIKREEEEKRLAEELKVEEERQAALLEQLRKEEEERKQKMLEEKEQKEQEEKLRLEQEQKEREEEIDRKTKLEIEKRQKEQEEVEQKLDAERIERKKRVEMIMARVSAKRNDSNGDQPAPDSPPKDESAAGDNARLKVDDILRSRGLGRSSEDLLTDEGTSLLDESQTTSEEPAANLPDDNQTSSDATHDSSLSEVVKEKPEEIAKLEETPAADDTKPVNVSLTSDEVLLVSNANVSSSTTEISVESENIKDNNNTSVNETVENIENSQKENIVSDDSHNTGDSHVNDLSVGNIEVNANISITQEVPSDEKETQNVVGTNEKDVDTSSEPLVNGQTLQDDAINEKEQWQAVEERMKTIQSTRIDENTTEEESKLWKVMEGKVELSECF